jgi:hypothetical protein
MVRRRHLRRAPRRRPERQVQFDWDRVNRFGILVAGLASVTLLSSTGVAQTLRTLSRLDRCTRFPRRAGRVSRRWSCKRQQQFANQRVKWKQSG